MPKDGVRKLIKEIALRYSALDNLKLARRDRERIELEIALKRHELYVLLKLREEK